MGTEMIGVLASKQTEHYTQRNTYIESVLNAGFVPMLIPADSVLRIEDLGGFLHYHCPQGVLLPGGVDISPGAYDADNRGSGQNNFLDDIAYDMVFAECMRQRIPVMGICKGFQFIAMKCGWEMDQDLSQVQVTHTQSQQRWTPTHHVKLFPWVEQAEFPETLNEVLTRKTLKVNSMHHQGFKKQTTRMQEFDCGNGILKVGPILESKDLVMEAIVGFIEDTDYPLVLGVQWHPEEFLSDSTTNFLSKVNRPTKLSEQLNEASEISTLLYRSIFLAAT